MKLLVIWYKKDVIETLFIFYMVRNLGYACINTELRNSEPNVYCSRTMIKRTFERKGLHYAGELALKNVLDLEKILQWNESHDIKFFRISSDLFPVRHLYNYDIRSLPQWKSICTSLERSGRIVKALGHRVSFHPDHFVKLASKKKDVVDKSMQEVSHFGELFDYMGLERSVEYKINIHIGGSYGNKSETLKRFKNSYIGLPYHTSSRLTVENDDKESMYTVEDLEVLDIPIVFDFFHHKLHHGGVTVKNAFMSAYNTWPSWIVPVAHWSESRREESGDNGIRKNAHSDLVSGPFPDYGVEYDLMIEAKEKEQSILNLKKTGNY